MNNDPRQIARMQYQLVEMRRMMKIMDRTIDEFEAQLASMAGDEPELEGNWKAEFEELKRGAG